MELKDARVLLVGATGVLGRLLADRLSAAGSRLVVTGRHVGRLSAVAERVTAVEQLLLDVVDVEAGAHAVTDAATALGGLDSIVIASGVAAFGSARDDDDAVVEELFAVNTLGPIALVRAALGHLSPGGSVVVITAVLADVPTAQMAAYSGSKAAISAYLTALRREVRRDKITVLDVRPPHLDTGLADRPLAGQAPRMPAGHDIGEVIDLMIEGMATDRSELVADLGHRTVRLQ